MAISISNFLKKLKNSYTPSVYVIRQAKTEDGVDGSLVSYADEHSYLAEQYKVIRTNLYSLSPEKPFKTVVITSAQSQEGKTVTSCNLSYTLSLDTEKKILLLDADFRRPSVHKVLGIQRKPGFTNILNDEVSLEQFIKKPAVGNLYVIPSGSVVTNTAELLSSKKMRELIDMLKLKFDYLVFDTPPVINVTDSSILGSLCDCVIMIVRAGVTPKSMVEEAYTMLRHAQAKPKACILTDTSIPVYYYYLSRYKYYYNYRYGYVKSADKKNNSPSPQ